jgi:colicin import membrane protein
MIPLAAPKPRAGRCVGPLEVRMTGGPERRDESVNFSLKELMKLEDERISQERQAREARDLAAKVARDEAERREREELAARERADDEERERARFREMEEEARREAMQRAAVEQARITVEARTRAEESDRERRHEIELQRMRAETVKKPGPGGYIASSLGGAAVALAVCLVMYFGVSKPTSDKRIAELDRAVAGAEGRESELGRRVDEQKARIGQLEKSLTDMQEELGKRPVVAATPPRTPAGPAPGPKRGGPGSSSDSSKGKGANDGPPCPKFDPLCFHIDTH